MNQPDPPSHQPPDDGAGQLDSDAQNAGQDSAAERPPQREPLWSPEVGPYAPPLPPGILERNPWFTFVLPIVVYMVVGSFEPKPPGEEPVKPDEEHVSWMPIEIEYHHYPIIYTVKIALTLAAMLFVFRGYLTFPFYISPIAWVFGAVGVVVWVGLCHLQPYILGPLGLMKELGLEKLGERSAFNPLKEIADPTWAHTFLGIRFFGLVVIVPIMEEFFLRGFLLRFMVDMDYWWKVPFALVNPIGIVAGTAVPVMMHPAELLAATVWFSGVTWLMLRTKNIWDCVIMHAVTNLLMGLWVVYSGEWKLM